MSPSDAEAAAERSPENWHVAQLKPKGLPRALENLARQGYPVFCPEQTVSRRTARGLVDTRVPLFPGYLFVQFDPTIRGWSALNSTRGIARLLLDHPSRPAPLPQQLMTGLLGRCDATGLLLPPDDLRPGERVRVLSGPFAAYVATVEKMAPEERVTVLFELMGRQGRVSMPRSSLERLK
ncbi:transcription termination/antitermination NusG family protein [Psychromarinibacter sp. C21-152]|uniref:Transcription termination/antitermination NusG family protein n=1 Tax=Psychromarinibacter sediminicola TaxID=3033385 RepID=A0AAE3NNV2_9RHOB|nr:transcription termination/antitermination NusG family protein [Psychromarinibacter sediminicola]MDF0599277.1 transcription termination/antitermination NusG family protein [Psychromarinibacter sediminicola]